MRQTFWSKLADVIQGDPSRGTDDLVPKLSGRGAAMSQDGSGDKNKQHTHRAPECEKICQQTEPGCWPGECLIAEGKAPWRNGYNAFLDVGEKK